MTASRASAAVGVGILNYNTRAILLENLESCLRSGLPAERLLVWDNASSDDSVAAVRERFPGVRCVASERNLGYADGMNGIVAALDTPYVVLATADCFLTAEAVEALRRTLASANEIALAGCRILDRRTAKVQSDGGDITFPTGTPLARHWQEVPSPAKPEPAVDVSYLDGAILGLNREAFRRLGGFDGSYFAYQEDVDLSWRARLCGYRVACLESVSVVHGTWASFSRYPMLRWMLSERNRIASNLKNLEWPHLLLALLYEGLYASALSVAAGRLGLPRYRRAYFRGLVSLLERLRPILHERRRVQGMRVRTDREVLGLHRRMGLRELAKALSTRAELARQVSA